MDSSTVAGINWWNSLAEDDRALWMRRAGSAVPADAWAYFNIVMKSLRGRV